LGIGFIDTPRLSRLARKAIPSPFKLWNIVPLNPTLDRRMAHRNPRSSVISTKSRNESLYRKYQRMQNMMISCSMCRPLNNSSTLLSIVIAASKSGQVYLIRNFAPEPNMA
jgi:hypothetical protein